VLDYVNKNKLYLYRQFVDQGMLRVSMPNPVALYLRIYGKPSAKELLPTFDIDGILTTVMEMLQPKEVSKLGILGYYDNDRQVRREYVESQSVSFKRFEHTLVAAWPYDEEEFSLQEFEEAERLLHSYGGPPLTDNTDKLSELLNEFES
jgi:hypothetical protein